MGPFNEATVKYYFVDYVTLSDEEIIFICTLLFTLKSKKYE